MDLGSNPGHVLYETLDMGPNFPESLMIISGTQQELNKHKPPALAPTKV